MPEALRKRRRISSFQFIVLGFAGLILAGALLLMLPFASRDGRSASFGDALFTATSAVCVTGLVVRDTAIGWSCFGQAVILTLIQVGGMGVITTAACFALLSSRRISLSQRSSLQDCIAAPNLAGIVRLTGFVIRTTFAIELLGALVMMPTFCGQFGLRGVWMALFHSISAFCNAGFDLMGRADGAYASLTAYAANPAVSGTIALLIVVGGIGFCTWDDVRTHKLHLKRYQMQSKVILAATAILILLPGLYLYCFEYANLPAGERALSSLFQAVTPRTAGFNTRDLTKLSSVGRSLMIVLMLIGGAPGSTAGGMKTTTVAVLFANALAVFSRRDEAQLCGRRIDASAVRTASTVLLMYLTLFFGGALILSAAEGLPLGSCLFEAASAIGTVGLTLGITPGLGTLSRIVLIALMFLGRVGGLTLVYAASGVDRRLSRLPKEAIAVG